MKKLIALAFAFGLVGAVGASELWWCVATPKVTAEIDGEYVDFTWDTAILYANKSGYNTLEGNGAEVARISAADMEMFGDVTTALGTYANSSYYFYIELVNSAQTVKSYVNENQGAVSYSDLVKAGAIDDGNVFNPSAASPYTFENFTGSEVIPEPTSAVLLLFGLAGLALKRKRS